MLDIITYFKYTILITITRTVIFINKILCAFLFKPRPFLHCLPLNLSKVHLYACSRSGKEHYNRTYMSIYTTIYNISTLLVTSA